MNALRIPCLAALLLLAACAAPRWEWSSYAADPASTRFAPLSQIDGGNFPPAAGGLALHRARH